MAARRIRIAIGALALLLILIGVWAAFRNRASPTVREPATSRGLDQEWDVRARSINPPKVSDLWARPPAEVASRNHRKSGFAWILRQLGATELQLDRLADGDFAGLVTELKQKAQSGDADAINMLGEIALQNCDLARSNDTLRGFKQRQLLEAHALPALDSAWFTAILSDDIAFDTRVAEVCKQLIDQDEILSWVWARAAQGDGASLWLQFRSSNNLTDMQQRLRDAAAAGFPQAQFELAWAIISGQKDAGGIGAEAVTAGDMLRQSADQLAASEAQLAVCEYSGCDGVTPDIDSAIKHAREAAQAGAMSAMIGIGPHLPAGQIDPDEVAAWSLIDASLQQQGCAGNIFTVRSGKQFMDTLSAKNISARARTLAEQYWSDYGSQITANLGCAS
jgi:hypothetical protein